MRRRHFLALIAASLLPTARPFSFEVGVGKVECFQELAKASDHVSGDWQLQGTKKLDAPADELPTLDVQVGPDCARATLMRTPYVVRAGEAHGGAGPHHGHHRSSTPKRRRK